MGPMKVRVLGPLESSNNQFTVFSRLSYRSVLSSHVYLLSLSCLTLLSSDLDAHAHIRERKHTHRSDSMIQQPARGLKRDEGSK